MRSSLPDGGYAEFEDMPGDFAPTLEDQGDRVVCHRHGGVSIELGYAKTGDDAYDEKLDAALRQAVWQILEFKRLSRPRSRLVLTKDRRLRAFNWPVALWRWYRFFRRQHPTLARARCLRHARNRTHLWVWGYIAELPE